MFVLDTNTLIYFFRGQGLVGETLLQTPPKDIGIPSIVVFELAVGIQKSSEPEKRQEELKTLLSTVAVLPFRLGEAERAAKIRVELERIGKPIGPYDLLIAATALTQGATLVTHNAREFGRIEGLHVVDWF